MRNRKLYISVLIALLLAGCSLIEVKPDDIQETSSPDPQIPSSPGLKKTTVKKSTVVFYRPDQSISGWTWKDINIMEIHALGLVTDPGEESQVTHVGTLKNNSFIKREFKSGTHRFTANWELQPYEFTLKPDEEMCIKAEIGFFNALQRRATLKIVDKIVCQTDIENAKEMLEEN